MGNLVRSAPLADRASHSRRLAPGKRPSMPSIPASPVGCDHDFHSMRIRALGVPINVEGTDSGVALRDAGAPPGGAMPAAPPVQPASPSATVGAVTFRGSPNRIAPTQNVTVPVTLAALPPGGSATFDVEGSGGANGVATVSSGATMVASGSVTLVGGAQTTPGNAGNLRLRARLGATVLGRSAGFTVAAWPTDFVTSLLGDIDGGGAVGVRVANAWTSDGSGSGAELDEVERTERVDIGTRDNPPFTSNAGTSGTIGTSGFLPGTASPTTDRHSYSRAAIVTGGLAPGSYTLAYRQNFLFNCRRTGVVNGTVPKSGFTITHTAWFSGPTGNWMHFTRKTGAAVTVEGRATTAGAGTADSLDHRL
jgi:hypothetical protein